MNPHHPEDRNLFALFPPETEFELRRLVGKTEEHVFSVGFMCDAGPACYDENILLTSFKGFTIDNAAAATFGGDKDTGVGAAIGEATKAGG